VFEADMISSAWADVLSSWDARSLVFHGTNIILVLPYWLFGCMWLILDIAHRPGSWYRTKIQPSRPFKVQGSDSNPPLVRAKAHPSHCSSMPAQIAY